MARSLFERQQSEKPSWRFVFSLLYLYIRCVAGRTLSRIAKSLNSWNLINFSFQVWDKENPSVTDFVRIKVSEGISPNKADVTIGSLVSFTTNIANPLSTPLFDSIWKLLTKCSYILEMLIDTYYCRYCFKWTIFKEHMIRYALKLFFRFERELESIWIFSWYRREEWCCNCCVSWDVCRLFQYWYLGYLHWGELGAF